MHTTRQAGVSLVEVIVGVALIAAILVVISQLITLYLTSVTATQDKVVATYQAEAALEAARIIRDTDWNDLDTQPLDTPLYLSYGPGSVALVATNPAPGAAYQVELQLRAVYRDSVSDEIVSSGGVGTYTDTEARLVEVTVQKDGASIATQTALLTNLFDS